MGESKVWTYGESGQHVCAGSDAHSNDALQAAVHRDTWILLEQRVREFLTWNSERLFGNWSSIYPKCFSTNGRVSASWSIEGYSYLKKNITIENFKNIYIVKLITLYCSLSEHHQYSFQLYARIALPRAKAPTSKQEITEINACPSDTHIKSGCPKYIRRNPFIYLHPVKGHRLPDTDSVCVDSPSGKGVGSFMLPQGVDMTHSKMLHDFRHVLMVEERVPASFVCT